MQTGEELELDDVTAELPKLTGRPLQAIHRDIFGKEHTIANCQHLRRKIAWHIQATKDGVLSKSVRQYALTIARGTQLSYAYRATGTLDMINFRCGKLLRRHCWNRPGMRGSRCPEALSS